MSDQALGSLGRESCFLDKGVEWSLISVYAVSLVLGALLLSLALGFLRWAWVFFWPLRATAAVPFIFVTGIMPVHLFWKQVKRRRKKEPKLFQSQLNHSLTDSCCYAFWGMSDTCFPSEVCAAWMSFLGCWIGRKWSITKQSFELTFIILSPVENA